MSHSRVYPPPPPATSPAASTVMRANTGTDSRPERLLRAALHRRGLSFRKNMRPPGISCRVDILFVSARVAVFVDGCFWHRCPDHGVRPVSNKSYWDAKLDRNVARDRANDEALAGAGWTVVRVWEHESPESAADQIADVVRGRMATRRSVRRCRRAREAGQPLDIDRGAQTVAEFVETYWQRHVIPTLSANTRDAYERVWANHARAGRISPSGCLTRGRR